TTQFGARAKGCRVRASAGLGEAVAREMLHRAELGQEALALRLVAEAVDHPSGHVMDRDVGRGAWTGRRQLLHDQRRIETREGTSADIVADIDAAEAQSRGLTQGLNRKDLLGIPFGGARQHLVGRELARGIAKSLLILGK